MAGVAPEVPRALAGRYRLVRLLARGGMAEVWEGRDEVLSRPVAVKVLMAHLASDPFLRERFRREAVTAARLVHPGIVAIFDAGVEVLGEEGTGAGALLSAHWSRDENQRLEMAWPDEPSTAFIVMELVPGETLRDLMSRTGPMAPDLAFAIVAQVAEAVAYAHAQGLVHRDIKPANVLLGTEGPDLVRVKVADFGIAKAAATAHLDLTASGTLLGTPKYLSPEQVQGEEPDARSDLYSLGVVLYEMLAGRPPFKEGTEMATALAHVQQQVPPLRGLRPGLPAPAYELVDALLMKDRAQRVPSALVLGGSVASVRKLLGVPTGDNGPYVHVKVATGAKRPPTDATQQGTSSLPPVVATQVALPTGGKPTATARRPASAEKAQARRRKRHRTGRTASVLVAVLLVAGSLVLLDLLRTGDHVARTGNGGGSPAPSHQAGPIGIVSVREVAQDGNQPNDNLGTLDDVITGRSPAWTSALYQGPNFGNYGGLGLAVELKSTYTLDQLKVSTTMLGWSAQVYVSSSFHSAVADWGKATSFGSDLDGDHTFSLGGRQGRWALFWMLDPGPSYRAVVQHLTVT